jgi:hypothetical protein
MVGIGGIVRTRGAAVLRPYNGFAMVVGYNLRDLRVVGTGRIDGNTARSFVLLIGVFVGWREHYVGAASCGESKSAAAWTGSAWRRGMFCDGDFGMRTGGGKNYAYRDGRIAAGRKSAETHR